MKTYIATIVFASASAIKISKHYSEAEIAAMDPADKGLLMGCGDDPNAVDVDYDCCDYKNNWCNMGEDMFNETVGDYLEDREPRFGDWNYVDPKDKKDTDKCDCDCDKSKEDED